ncbi:MAG: hypothetical protein GY932_07780 [Arcobacter sp.]|nr:hypothetical protein [Arcobacter sp.]
MRHTYNQNLEYYTRNSCTIYTIAHIFRTQWKIEVPQEALIEATKAAEEA